MVRRNAFRCMLVTVALLGGRIASADPITFTGNVATDFSATNPGVNISAVDSDPLNTIYQLPQMTSQGYINGYAIKDIRTFYDFTTDKLYVGVNTWSIAGSAVGAGGSAMDTILAQHGGSDPASLGGDKSITLAFVGSSPSNTSTPGQPIIVAGVPADKSTASSTGLDGFTVASYKGLTSQGIQYNYGTILPSNQGSLAFDPSAAHPNFEFTINNFSKISSTLDPTKGFWIQAYAGSAQDGPIGEEVTGLIKIPAFQNQNIPEPTTWLAWTLVLGGSLRQLRRRGKKS